MELDLMTVVVLLNVFWTFGLSIVYIYLYRQYQDVYMGIWGLAWLLSSSRIGMDLFRYYGYDSVVLLLINMLVSIVAVLLQLWGMYNLKGLALKRSWLFGAFIVLVFMCVGIFIGLPLNLYIIPIAIYISLAYIWIGVSFLRYWKFIRMGKYITGSAFILVGLINITYPFNAAGDDPNTTAIFYTIGLIPWLITIIGILIVYFEKTRNEISLNEQRFRMLLENARDVVYRIKLKDGVRFDYISPAVERITGYKPGELYSSTDLVSKIVGQNYKDFFQEIRSTDGQLKLFKIYTKNGEEVWVEQTFVPIFNSQGEMVAAEGILRDISDRKKLEGEMVRLDSLRLTGETAAGLAHEVRNPLTTVRGFLQIMEQKPLFKECLEVIKLMITELDRANSIISNFLTFSRVQIHHMKVQNLTEQIKGIMPLVESNALYAGKTIKASLEKTPDFKFDGNEIKQLVLNLVQNGLEAMDPGGTLEIKTLKEDGMIKLIIKDEGPGIPKDFLAKLGTPFFTTKEKGTGLGLAVCYGIAAKHQANISVASGSEGTTFTITFNL